ncbi:carboxylating nicotinate-nucleotide diphosphorylase, partial [Desulforudis sp. 1190]
MELVSRAQIEQWLAEDIGPGDITSQAVIPEDAVATGRFICKEEGVVAGLGLLPLVFSCLDSDVVVTAAVQDGERVFPGTVPAL